MQPECQTDATLQAIVTIGLACVLRRARLGIVLSRRGACRPFRTLPKQLRRARNDGRSAHGVCLPLLLLGLSWATAAAGGHCLIAIERHRSGARDSSANGCT